MPLETWLQEIVAGWAAFKQAPLLFIVAAAQQPTVRMIGLFVLLYLMIIAIAAIYGGDIQNTKLGPIALRRHPARTLSGRDVRLPRSLLKMGLDGVHATCVFYYVYYDRRGRQQRRKVAMLKDVRLNVVPNAIPRIQDMRFGIEISPRIADLPFEDVVIPVLDPTPAEPVSIEPTPDRVGDYLRRHQIIEAWREDDAAEVVTVAPSFLDQLSEAREAFIVSRAQRVRRARSSWWRRIRDPRAAVNAANVCGSFYLQLKLSRSPFFILRRHPDRDLKMTAWLTVLTSIFAIVMEAWPAKDAAGRSATHEAGRAASRVPGR